MPLPNYQTNHFAYSKKFFTLLSIFALIFINLRANEKEKIKNDFLIIEEKLYFNPQEGEKMLNILLESLDENQKIEYQSDIKFLQGFLLYSKGEFDSAIGYMQKSMPEYAKTNSTSYQAKTQLILGWILENLGYKEQAKINYYKAIEQLDKSYIREIGYAYFGIARCKKYFKEDFEEEMELGAKLLNSLLKPEYTLYPEYMSLILRKWLFRSDHATIIGQTVPL